MKRIRDRAVLILLFAAISSLIAACGFHLRGSGDVVFPPELSTMRVEMAGSRRENDPLQIEMEDALRLYGHVTVVKQGDFPKLIIERESVRTETLSVNTIGKVQQFLIRYEISFRLAGATGKEILSSESVRLQRNYNFDPNNVIAKQLEEENLRADMRRDAVYRIARRLARVKS